MLYGPSEIISVYQPPRALEEIDRELKVLGADLQRLLQEVMA
jgi:hypothetical protein